MVKELVPEDGESGMDNMSVKSAETEKKTDLGREEDSISPDYDKDEADVVRESWNKANMVTSCV